MRTEHDFIGELQVPDDVYYGVQTMRAIDNFKITGQTIDPDFVQAFAKVKKAAALANMATGRLPKEIGEPLVQAADEIIEGKWLKSSKANGSISSRLIRFRAALARQST